MAPNGDRTVFYPILMKSLCFLYAMADSGRLVTDFFICEYSGTGRSCMKKLSLWPTLVLVGITFANPSFAFGAPVQNAEVPAVSSFPLWSLFPFILMLVSIAVLPLTVPHWWDSNRNKIILSVALSVPVLGVVLPTNPQLLWHSLLDYVSFLTLLGSLFVISGGIYLKGEFAGTPLVNAIFLAIGALFANVIGTTGASMLLIRPFLRANHLRRHRAHLIVFFIFIVSNTAGLLTPLVDPPLFLGC